MLLPCSTPRPLISIFPVSPFGVAAA